jgi:predicted permease
VAPFLRRLRARIKYRHFERDLVREIEVHRAMALAAIEGGGESRQEARWRAARLLGNTTLVREEVRDMWIPRLLQQLSQDARYAARAFRREWGFTLAAVSMLAIGLGLTAGGFAFVSGMFFRGWPVPDNHDVFRAVPVLRESAGRIDDGLSMGAYKHISSNAKTADYIAMGSAYSRVGATKEERGAVGTSVPLSLYVSDNFFQALQIPLQMGTPPLTGQQTQIPNVVISHVIWRTTFQSDPAVLGRTVWLDGRATTIVGVTAASFTGLDRSIAVFVPIWAAPQMSARGSVRDALTDERSCCVLVAGRARPGATRSAILSELEGLTSQYRAAAAQPALTLRLADTTSGEQVMRRGSLAAILAMFGAGALALLVLTCANVGNLYLARSLRRQHEVATRLALGASRARLIRQFLTEGLVLSAAAGIVAFGAAVSVPVLMRLSGADPSSVPFSPDWRVALVTAIAVVFVCAFVSLAPALRATRVVWRGGASMTTARSGGLRGTLLAVQIAIATVLIISAALIARGIQHGLSAPSDFALATTMAAKLEWPANSAPTGDALKAFRAGLAGAVAASPVPMGLSTNAPVSDNSSISTSVRQPSSNIDFSIRLFPMDAAAAGVLQMRLVAGRWPSEQPGSNESVINETLARQIWGEVSPIGQPLSLDFDKRTYTVVGVSADAHLVGPVDVPPMMHTPPIYGTPFILASNTAESQAAVRAIASSLAPTLRVRFTPLAESVRGTLGPAMGAAIIAGGLGLVALLLAMIGVYSVFSYLVEERRREIGIRVALGASRTAIRRAVFHATRWSIGSGVMAGLVLSVLVGLALRRFLFGMSPADPVSYAVVALLLVGTAMLATFVPIRRALRVNPAVTLKGD